MVRTQIAHVHVLRTSLRKQATPDELIAHLTDEARAIAVRATNVPTAVLTHIGMMLSEAAGRGMVTDVSRHRIESTLTVLSDAQGGLERIKNTPLPVQYRFLPSFFRAYLRLFCRLPSCAICTGSRRSDQASWR